MFIGGFTFPGTVGRVHASFDETPSSPPSLNGSCMVMKPEEPTWSVRMTIDRKMDLVVNIIQTIGAYRVGDTFQVGGHGFDKRGHLRCGVKTTWEMGCQPHEHRITRMFAMIPSRILSTKLNPELYQKFIVAKALTCPDGTRMTWVGN